MWKKIADEFAEEWCFVIPIFIFVGLFVWVVVKTISCGCE